MTKGHALLAAFVCVALPGASWLDGYGSLAWTMYSGSGSYRMSLAAIDADGRRSALAPSALARFAGREEATYFVGADAWRMASSRGLRLRLPEVAMLACRLGPAAHVEATLETKRTLDAPVEVRTATASCDAITER